LIGKRVLDLEATIGQRPQLAGQLRERLRNAVETLRRGRPAAVADARAPAGWDRTVHRNLSGAKLALDLLTAGDFGVAGAARLIEDDPRLDLSDRDRLIASLAVADGRRIVAAAKRAAADPGRRFFHWELEFP